MTAAAQAEPAKNCGALKEAITALKKGENRYMYIDITMYYNIKHYVSVHTVIVLLLFGLAITHSSPLLITTKNKQTNGYLFLPDTLSVFCSI